VMTGACYHTQLSPMRCGSLELWSFWSQVARITGMNYHLQLHKLFYLYLPNLTSHVVVFLGFVKSH
jgi:hypothetical protein